MKLLKNHKYLDREGAIYQFIEYRGGVSIFSKDGKEICRNRVGMYRWDDKPTSIDIVKKNEEL